MPHAVGIGVANRLQESATRRGRVARFHRRAMPARYSPFFCACGESSVQPGAGVGVDDAHALVAAREVVHQLHQHQVLQHVGMVAGVEGDNGERACGGRVSLRRAAP